MINITIFIYSLVALLMFGYNLGYMYEANEIALMYKRIWLKETFIIILISLFIGLFWFLYLPISYGVSWAKAEKEEDSQNE